MLHRVFLFFVPIISSDCIIIIWKKLNLFILNYVFFLFLFCLNQIAGGGRLYQCEGPWKSSWDRGCCQKSRDRLFISLLLWRCGIKKGKEMRNCRINERLNPRITPWLDFSSLLFAAAAAVKSVPLLIFVSSGCCFLLSWAELRFVLRSDLQARDTVSPRNYTHIVMEEAVVVAWIIIIIFFFFFFSSHHPPQKVYKIIPMYNWNNSICSLSCLVRACVHFLKYTHTHTHTRAQWRRLKCVLYKSH